MLYIRSLECPGFRVVGVSRPDFRMRCDRNVGCLIERVAGIRRKPEGGLRSLWHPVFLGVCLCMGLFDSGGAVSGQTAVGPVMPPLPPLPAVVHGSQPVETDPYRPSAGGGQSSIDSVPEEVSDALSRVEAAEPVRLRFDPQGRYVLDRILIQPRADVSVSELARLHEQFGVRRVRILTESGGLCVVNVPAGLTVRDLVGLYEKSGLVDYAEPDYRVRLSGNSPNDPKFLDGSLWGLHNRGDEDDEQAGPDIHALEAWKTRRTAERIVVAVVDTGVRYTHQDLAENMWVDSATGGHGVNVLSGSNDPMDDNGHGTLMAGILGAVGDNGIGSVGVAWKVQIMACKFVNRYGEGAISDAVACIDFARNKGAQIINASWGVDDYSRALFDGIRRMHDSGIIVVAAAGNGTRDLDKSPYYPASYDLANIVCVAATTRNDELLFVSNYGSKSVDLGAPGEQILSTSYMADDQYSTDSGSSSSAAAFVSGAFALMRARYPLEDHLATIRRVIESTDSVRALKGRSVTGGRLNLRKALGPPVAAPKFWFRLGEEPLTLRMVVAGEPGLVYVVEASSDLVIWKAIYRKTVTETETFLVPRIINLRNKPEFFRVFSMGTVSTDE